MTFPGLENALGIQEQIQQRKKRALPKGEEVKTLNCRIPKSLLKRVKLYCLREDVSVQDFLNGLLSAYLDEVG